MKKENKNKDINKEKANSKKIFIIILILVVIILISIGIILGQTVCNNKWKEANENYNIAYERVLSKNEELSKLISDSENLVYSDKKALDESLKPTLETVITESKADIKELPKKPLFTNKINEKVEELNNINYEKTINNLNEKYNSLNKSIKQYELVDKPTEAYIISCLKKVPGIVDMAAATEENDPNGKLNKQGGYTSQVYFSCEYVNQNEVYGDTIIDKGTDAGGSIEVYTTEEDAKKREDYLSGFDGGILSSGSHKVIGTVLIRTSNELTATKQKELETSIVNALTNE